MANGGRLTSPIAQRWGIGAMNGAPVGEMYIGQDYTTDNGRNPSGNTQFVNVEAAASAYAALSPSAQKKVYSDALAYYGGKTNVPAVNLPSFYADTVRNAYQVQQSTGLKVTPLDYWDYYRQTGGPGLNSYLSGGSGGSGGPKTTTSTSETVNLTDPDTARGLIESAIGSELGRRPTEKEYANFMNVLTARAEASPSVSKTTTTSGKGFSTSKGKTQGGFNAQQVAKEYAGAQEGAAETAVATAGFDAFISLIGG
jgi:hypothetical protein